MISELDLKLNSMISINIPEIMILKSTSFSKTRHFKERIMVFWINGLISDNIDKTSSSTKVKVC
ncbi:hypothetical protein KSS87_020309 [Heliosperma pusillum]|nr:hypothetical protein KSS87_020309 [Heliosperma pusillum]